MDVNREEKLYREAAVINTETTQHDLRKII